MMIQPQPQRTLPADVFDTIDLTSFAYEGIGAGDDFEYLFDRAIPFCVHGQACESDNGNGLSEVSNALYRAGISRDLNDQAVRSINQRKKQNINARVDFLTEYCPELNIVRGD